MPNRREPNILITIDGLFLFYFDEKNKRCEVKIHTAAQGHRMKIEVKDSNSKFVKTFRQDQIKSLQPFSLFIGAGDEPRPIPNSAIVERSFEKILDLSGSNFYGRSLEIKRGKYDASIFVNNGVIEAGNMSKCHRVKEKFFNMLEFKKITKADWDALVREARKKDEDSITDTITFAGEVIATINLKKGEKFWITHGRKNEKLFEPLEPGKNYEVMVKYSDIKKPVSFADCLGFAHHCKALKLEKDETVFGIFGPRIIKGFGPITPGGCCRCARISLPIKTTGSIKTKGKRG